MKKIIIFLSFMVATLLMVEASFARKADNVLRVENKAVAKVNGSLLTDFDLNEALQKLIPAASFHGGISPQTRAKYRPKAVQSVIEDELLYQNALKTGIDIDPKVVKKVYGYKVQEMVNEQRLTLALETIGMDIKKYKDRIYRRLVIKEFIQVEIDEKLNMTEEDIKAYYEENKLMYKRPASIRLNHIFINVDSNSPGEVWVEKEATAKEVLAKLKNGENFAEVASKHSDDDFKVMGGRMGLKHKGQLAPDLEAEVWKLKAGELSGVIKTIYGYHLVFVNEKIEAEQLSYEQVSGRIKKDTEHHRKSLKKANLLERLKKDATIEVYEQKN